tara:strand:- start:1116 stop:1814 length:699 start_codon:yes stop_codon:yes gene_type:complete
MKSPPLSNDFSLCALEIEKLFKKYQGKKNVEFEARLGYFTEEEITKGNVKKFFDTNVGEQFFNTILKTLQTSKIWNKTRETNLVDYYSSGLRMTVTRQGEQICIKKKRLEVLDFRYEDTPFDIRFSVSTEDPQPVDTFQKPHKGENYETIREKLKYQFFYKQWSFDLSIVSFEDNGISRKRWEVELELVDKDFKDYKYLSQSILLKIKDMVNMCEKINPDAYLDIMQMKDFL